MIDAKMKKTHGKEYDGKCKAVTVHPRRKSATCQCDGVCDEGVGPNYESPNYGFKEERIESSIRRPMLDTSCETRELLVQKQELSKTSTGNQAAIEMNRREYPTSNSNSLSTVNIRSMSFLIVQKSREQPSNTEPQQRVETVNKSVDTSHSVLNKINEITNTTPMHNKTHTAVGSSHFIETVFRPVEQGSQPPEYLQGRNVSSTCHKQMELNKTISSYTPRKVQMTNHQKPYILRPTHNETNCPEDPTLPSHPEPLGHGLPRNKVLGDEHNSSFQTRQRTVATTGTNNYDEAGSEWERQYQKHCQENEALEMERKRRLQREDNRNRLDNRLNKGVPKRDSLSKIRKRPEKNSSTNKSDNYESCFQTERHCPSHDPVKKNLRDVYTSPQRNASRIMRDRNPSNDRQMTNERIGNSNIERILSRNSVYDRRADHERHPTSYDRFTPIYERLLGQDRYANFERRNSRIPQEIQENYLGRDRLLGPDGRGFQDIPVNGPERLERSLLSRRERKMREEPRKASKRGLDATEQVDCECAEVAKKVSKGTGKGDAKKCRNTKPKTKTALCQCPPSPVLRTTKLSKMKSDTRMSTDDDMDLVVDEGRAASRCSLRGGRTYTKMVQAPLPSSFQRMTRARSASCTWNVQSESEIGDSWIHDMRRSVYTTTSKLFDRVPSRAYGITSMDCNGCSDNKSLSSQSSRVSCSKSSCCSCPSNKRSKCHSSKPNRKKSQKDKVLTKVISDIIETSAFQSMRWAADEDVGFEGQNVLMMKDDECSDSDDSDDDQEEVTIISPSKNDYRQNCDNSLKVECYPKNQCHTSKQSEMRRPKRKTVYQPTQSPTAPSTNRLIARRQRNPCSPCDLGQRGSCLSRLTEYPSSADVMDSLSLKRPCRQSRNCLNDNQCTKKSPTEVIKKRQSETSPCNNETSDCTMCMKKASQGTRETASGETGIRPRCILYQKDQKKSKHSPCKDCQCHKKRKSYNVCQVPTQTLQQWPTHNVETEEIKGYLRSLCRNCQCEKSYVESQTHNSQAQTKAWVSPNKSSDLRGYLQTTWRNCQCGKIKTVVETINKHGGRGNGNCITTAPIIQTLSTTAVGAVGIDSSALSVCRNCQCIKKKLCQKSNNTPMRMKKSYDQAEARHTMNLSSMDLRRYEDCVRSSPSCVAPTFKDQIVPDSSNDDLNVEYRTKPIKNKTSMEASTLVKQIEKTEIPEMPSVNSLPSLDEPLPNHLIAEFQERKKERNVKSTGCTTGAEFQKIDKYVSAVTKMRSAYNESKHAIFVSDADTCCSIDELKRNYSRGCHKKNSCHGSCKPSSKRKGKKCDRSQIFPEKQSCGVESRREETTTKRFPSDTRNRDQEYQPRGCVPYKPPPGTTTKKDTCERGSCFPSPCDSEKKYNADAKPEKLPRRKDSDRRVTVNSKVKTIEPPSPCPPEPVTMKSEEEPTQKTRVIEVKPKESLKSISQECGCTGAPLTPQQSLSKEKPKNKVDKSSSAHRVKKPHTDESKPKNKPIPTLKPKVSSEKPSKHNIKNAVLSDTKKISTDRRRRRDEVRGAKINTSMSDTQTSRGRLRSTSNDSRLRPPSRQASKTRNKSAPCNYRKQENEFKVKSNPKTIPSKETTPTNRLSEEKIPNKPKTDPCEPKVCADARKTDKTVTRDVAVDIRCPICTCATQCHGTRCYRSTDIINPNLKVDKEAVESPDNSLDDDALISDYTSEEITDTTLQSRTVCSRVAVEYSEKVAKLKHPCKTCCKSIEKMRRIKKANKATCTKARRLRDVGTATKTCKSDQISKRKTCCKREKGICTEGKLVTFKSCTQIIPPCCRDILSPSRYLLESQRAYNEMFSSKFLHTNMCPAFVSQKQSGFCASKIKRNSLRGYKAKKPEHHSLRRQTSPRVSEDRTRSDDSTRPAVRLLKGMRRYRLRNEAKLNAVRKQKWQRHEYESPTNKILTKSQENLCLQYGAAEDKSSSLAGHCNSASSF